MQLSSLPPFACAGVIGASNASWGSYPLPLDLALINMPGCKLYTSLDAVFPLANAGGTAPFVVTVPANPGLVGVAVWAQGLVASPGSNPTGVVVSNAAEIRIGAR